MDSSGTMDTDVSEVCFFGIYSHNQDAALRSGLEACEVALSEVRVPIRSVAAAKEQRRPPIRTMRGTMAYFSETPGWLFPVLVLGTLVVHLLAMTWTALTNVGTLRRADAIVVPHMGDTSVLAAKPIAVLLDVPLVYFSHNGLYFTLIENREFFSPDSVAGRLVKLLDRCCHSWADAVVVFSAESADRFAATMAVDRSRYAVMYIKAVESNFEVDPDDAISPAVDVLYWGNFHPHHGPETMVDAAAALPDRQFVFAGESDKRERVLERAADLEHVSFPGYLSLSALVRYIDLAGVVLGPVGDNTQTEFTIGTKVAEAAYLRKPIVVGDQPAINEVFDHRESAYLVEPGDPEDLADGIDAVLGDDELRARLADGAHRVYEEHFSTESAGRQLVEIIQDTN